MPATYFTASSYEKPASSTAIAKAVAARASLRQSISEEEAAAEAQRSRAADAQKERVIRGLFNSVVNGGNTTIGTLLNTNQDKGEQDTTSLIEKYYAEA